MELTVQLEDLRACNLFLMTAENWDEYRPIDLGADEYDYLQCCNDCGTADIPADRYHADVLTWSMQILTSRNCPPPLACGISKDVLDLVNKLNLSEQTKNSSGDDLQPKTLDRYRLWILVMQTVEKVCQQWQSYEDEIFEELVNEAKVVSVCAIKNTRRKMEDRHVIIPHVNTFFGLQDNAKTSFYAVFDGHAGTDAASYSASHLHYNIVHHPSYPKDIEKALKEAFTNTDKEFISTSGIEGLKSGSTALCCLIRDKQLYFAWLGDSQAILVRGEIGRAHV